MGTGGWVRARILRTALSAGGLALAGLALAGPAGAECGVSGYGYAGLEGERPVAGVAATITVLGRPRLQGGHVAAWVGVGGYGAGPGGADEWLQAGVATRSGAPSRLYVEWKTPGQAARLLFVGAPAPPGVAHRVTVSELPRTRNVWRAFVDGAPAGPLVVLPGSHARFRPVAVAETWDGGRQVCNRSAFRFRSVEVSTPSGAWGPLARALLILDPGQRLAYAPPSGFIAGAGG
jgi:hypothetical protein